jgi:hypothetical protein
MESSARVERKFTIVDAMILVAAIALGLAWWRADEAASAAEIARIPGYVRLPSPILTRIQDGTWRPATVLLPTWLLLRLRRPRARLRRLARTPGAAAMIALNAGLGLSVLEGIFNLGFRNHDEISRLVFLLRPVTSNQSLGGAVVLGVWLVLLVSGRWPRGRGWLEWLGLALGVYWVFWQVTFWLEELIHFHAPSLL